MKSRTVSRIFRVVGIKGKGPFAEFGTIVPKIAREVMARSGEIRSDAGREIAIFEPKKNEQHLDGEFYVGLMVEDPARETPVGMTYIEVGGNYAAARGKMDALNDLHDGLLKWATGNGHRINADEPIIEVYFPADTGEEVEIFLPILGGGADNRSTIFPGSIKYLHS